MDILLDNDLELQFSNAGDFLIGNSKTQRMELITISNPGDWSQWPLLGVGIINYLSGPLRRPVLRELERQISLQAKYDDLRVAKIQFTGEEFDIDVL